MFDDDNEFYFDDEDKEKIDEVIPSIKASMLFNNYETFEDYFEIYHVDAYDYCINIYDLLIDEGVYTLEELWDDEEDRFTDNVYAYAEEVYQYVKDRVEEEDFDSDEVVSEIDNEIYGNDKKITDFLSNIDSLSVKIAKWIYYNSKEREERKDFLKALMTSDEEEEEEEEEDED